MEHTTQLIRPLEKAKYLIELRNKAEFDIVLYWHRETIKADIMEDIFNNIQREV